MCGIAGYITKTKTDYRHGVAISVLAMHMESRGGHSWGMMTDAETERGVGSITRGLKIRANMPQSYALHTRYGTTGKITLENSHPFTCLGVAGLVVGMHNGVIPNHGELNAKYGRNCAVDSQHIFQHIADGLSLNDLTGYGAIVYSLNGEWYIGRFNDGEMSIAKTEHGIFFASTKDAVIEALSFAGIPVKKWLKVANNTVYRLTAKGLVKAYTVDAAYTRARWNDSLTKSSGSSIVWTPEPPRRINQGRWECELCGQMAEDLYDWMDARGQTDYCCLECYRELEGMEPDQYSEDLSTGYRFETEIQ